MCIYRAGPILIALLIFFSLTSRANAESVDWQLPLTHSTNTEGTNHPDSKAVTAIDALLSGFKFRKPIDILGPPDKELVNYQLRLEIGESNKSDRYDLHCEGKVFADFRDVRFVSSDVQTALPFYLEETRGKAPRRTATFWIKIPQIPKAENKPLRLYLYYGNPLAQDLSSPEDTFEFFDDFSGQGLDHEKWETHPELKGEARVINSELCLKNSTLRSRGFRFSDGIIEFKARIKGAAGIQGIIRGRKQKILFTPIEQAVYSSGFGGAEHTISVGNIVKVNIGNPILADKNYFYRIIAEGLNFTFDRYAAIDYKQEAELRFQDIGGLTDGYIGLRGESAMGQEAEVYFDWIRVRQYVKTLPRISKAGKEEGVK